MNDSFICGHGEILSEHPKDQDTLIYTITIENPGNKSYVIKSVEPIINEDIKELLIDKKQNAIKKARKLKGMKEIEFKGEINISTIKLSEAAIKNLLPAIKEYKITYDNDKEIILKSGI